jgi:hypothetical protein
MFSDRTAIRSRPRSTPLTASIQVQVHSVELKPVSVAADGHVAGAHPAAALAIGLQAPIRLA